MNRFLKLIVFCCALLLVAVPVLAADEAGDAGGNQTSAEAPSGQVEPTTALFFHGGAFAASLIIIGAGWGISRIASCAVESMARQPEVSGNIQTAMIISAALIEGATFFALIICIMDV